MSAYTIVTDPETLRDIEQDETETAIREDRPEPTDEQIEEMLERCYEIEKGNNVNEYRVESPEEWFNEFGPVGWWAVSNNDGIIAYFGTESLAELFVESVEPEQARKKGIR